MKNIRRLGLFAVLAASPAVADQHLSLEQLGQDYDGFGSYIVCAGHAAIRAHYAEWAGNAEWAEEAETIRAGMILALGIARTSNFDEEVDLALDTARDHVAFIQAEFLDLYRGSPEYFRTEYDYPGRLPGCTESAAEVVRLLNGN